MFVPMAHVLKCLMMVGLCVAITRSMAAPTPEQLSQLPVPAAHPVDFSKEIKPILEARCVNCHGHGRAKGDFRIDTRETILKGGSSGEAVIVGKSAESYLIELVMGFDPDNVMPRKGTKLSREQISLLRAWIDQGMKWDGDFSFARAESLNLKPRRPALPTGNAKPMDRLLESYFAANRIKPARLVDDRTFARRVYLDVIGLLPPPDALEKFVADKSRDKRTQLVRRLLAGNEDYALHWMSFWNDMLRNDYKGTGYIDGGRKQITQWLYSSLETNKSYDRFVAELVNPNAESEGFAKGIVWRGVVNASQTPAMQAAQNISQVFMGVNLKCASCHDSFINDWQLSDAYGLASVYADGPLEMVQCDKPTGKISAAKFIYSELGEITATTNKSERLTQLAQIITRREDGRLPRTLVNRYWQKFFGRGLVEPVDDMEKAAWNPDLLDWLAEDFVDSGYDVKHLIETILTSRAYQLPAVPATEQDSVEFVFTGPTIRRMSAEQFRDAVTALTGVGYSVPVAKIQPRTPSASLSKNQPLPLKPKWIWSDTNAAQKAKTGAVHLRKDFNLGELPTDAAVVVICDNSFFFNVNGQRVGDGDDFGKPYVFDIRSKLKKGANFIAAKAVNRLPGNVEPKDDAAVTGKENPAGFLFYARIRRGTNVMDFASDDSWRWSPKIADMNRPELPASWKSVAVLGEATIAPWNVAADFAQRAFANVGFGKVRAALVAADDLQTALGRPNREQVVTVRSPMATTMQALEMTNGSDLASFLARGAELMLAEKSNGSPENLIVEIYQKALGRKPTTKELQVSRELLGQPARKAGVEDLMWSLAMLPEFQLIY
jgi:hypothetical protein